MTMMSFMDKVIPKTLVETEPTYIREFREYLGREFGINDSDARVYEYNHRASQSQ